MPLQTIHRPKSFKEFYGNDDAVKSLISALSRANDVPHAYLITGPAGTGKTTIAYLIRDKLECADVSFHEYDASADRGIDAMRKIKSFTKYAPLKGSSIVVFLDEAHGITGAAQESILKLLESPPNHVYLILATTEPQKLKPTIKRRCHKISLRPLDKRNMIKLLRSVCEKEEMDYKQITKVIHKIDSVSRGSAGEALAHFDAVIDLNSVEEMLAAIEEVTFRAEDVLQLSRLLLNTDMALNTRWEEMKNVLRGIENTQAENVRQSILTYMMKVMLNNKGLKSVQTAAEVMSTFVDCPTMMSGTPALALACYLCLNESDVPI